MTYEDFCKALKNAQENERNTYNPSAFPGSAAWTKCNFFTKKIRSLKTENPEYVARMASEKEANKEKISEPEISESFWSL